MLSGKTPSGGGLSGRKKASGSTPTPMPPEPDPLRWEILETADFDGWCVVLVRYPGCTTYEGRKILVYDYPSVTVRAQTVLDPHFLEGSDGISPVARFEPTARGRRLAETLCRQRSK